MEEFTTNHVLKIFDMKRNTLQDWKDRGFIEPTGRAEGVQGVRDKYTLNDVYLIGLFKFLKEQMGLSRSKLDLIIKTFYSWSYSNPEKGMVENGFSFNNAGLGDDKKKYAVFQLSNEDGGALVVFHKDAPIDFGKSLTQQFNLVINLIAIKRAVDDLIEQNL